MATPKQLHWIGTCVKERAVPDALLAEAMHILQHPDAPVGKVLTDLFNCPRKAGAPGPEWLILQAHYPAVQPGYYAVGNPGQKTRFFRVVFGDTVNPHRYAGRLFVNPVIGGRSGGRVKPAVARAWLAAVIADGVAVARKRFASELGRCTECGRHLTDEPSRYAGYGPDCAKKLGIPWGAVAPAPASVTSVPATADSLVTVA